MFILFSGIFYQKLNLEIIFSQNLMNKSKSSTYHTKKMSMGKRGGDMIFDKTKPKNKLLVACQASELERRIRFSILEFKMKSKTEN